MFCKNCGNQIGEGKKFCTKCGSAVSMQNSNKENIQDQPVTSHVSIWQKINTSKIVMVLVVLGLIGYGMYSNRDESSIDTNNTALSTADSGNYEQAISGFQQASETAVSNDTKINTLKNLAFTQSNAGQYDQALISFNKALALAAEGSVDYYLISGEIALLEGKPNSALVAYNKAYAIDPNDFQTNNQLTLFYIDFEDSHPQFVDYKKALVHALKTDELSDLAVAKRNLALAYYFNENYDQTISILTSVDISNYPNHKYFLGLSYAVKGDTKNAKLYLQQAINEGVEVPQEVIDYLNNN